MEVIIIMKKAFLSHNSADKEYVLQVANELGYSSGIIDTHHFEEGHDLRDQIDKYLKEFKKSKEGNNSQILSRYVKGSWDDSPYNDDNNHYEEDHQDYNWVEEEEHEEI